MGQAAPIIPLLLFALENEVKAFGEMTKRP
jgi:hypothetical protein